MKRSVVTIVFLYAGLFGAAILVMNCSGKKVEQSEEAGHHHDDGDSTTQTEEMGIDSTRTAFVCPMHADITGKEGDKCSKCGMKLEAKNETEHQH